MEQFKEIVKKYFEFLNLMGYMTLEDSVAEVVSFRDENIRVDIMFSIIGYELTCQFVDKENKVFSLQDALAYEAIDEFKGFYQMANKADIEKGIAYLSEVVKIVFERINISNSVNFQKIYEFRVNRHKNMLENYYLETDLKRAEEHWRKKEYNEAQELFEKHIDYLSKSQLKKLEYIRKHTFSNQ